MNDSAKSLGASSHAAETAAGARFGFGNNWAHFLKHLDAARIQAAEQSLQQMLSLQSLQGKRVLDAGSGSGLFSLAARRLGAAVHSFDFDPQSVACTKELRRRHLAESSEPAGDKLWCVEEGSVLDPIYLSTLGQFDIVYSWGVLHHTGDQWRAMDNVSRMVKPGGRCFIAIYNDQGGISRWWAVVKRMYNRNALTRFVVIIAFTPYFIGLRWAYRRLTGRGKLDRGMSLWHDMVDWLGGYPFEVAKPEQVFKFFSSRGYELRALATAGSTGACNEFVFERITDEKRDLSPRIGPEGMSLPSASSATPE